MKHINYNRNILYIGITKLRKQFFQKSFIKFFFFQTFKSNPVIKNEEQKREIKII
jgi:hypothetical protein